jgi:hypothetical protein
LINIFKIKSQLPVTDYAPSWNISIGNTVWQDADKIDSIKNWLLANEDMIKEKYPVSTIGGDTGLGADSISSRIGMYNLFDFTEELPELKDLLKFLQTSYINFVKTEYASVYDLVLVSWVNILRSGENIREHVHSASNISYLSANLHLDNYSTQTIYKSPYERFNDFAFDNVKGGLTIFPSYVPHTTSEYTNLDVPRVSIAFDLRLPYTVPQDQPNHNFMSREIFEQLSLGNN